MLLKDDTRITITLGFCAILVLMSLIIYIALSELQLLNDSMSTVVKDTNVKLETANAMRDSIRLRANSLQAMALSEDIFVRDDEFIRFLSYARLYREARAKLITKPVTDREREILDKLTIATQTAQPVNEGAADLLRTGAPDADATAAVNEAVVAQRDLLKLLDELVEFERVSAEQALAEANGKYIDSRRLMLILTGIAICFGLFIAVLVIRGSASKNRRIYYQANHDELTGLLNRRAFEREFNELFEAHDEIQNDNVLLYLDLDQFKIVNDTCGHAAGDDLLRQLTRMLKNRLRNSDVFARLGGDEFGILLKNCGLEDAARLAESLRELAEGFHFAWKSREFSISASIGVVPVTRDRGTMAKILSTADMACLEAKQAGRNRVMVADVDDKKILKRRNEMDSIRDIKQALIENRFVLYFQPVVSIVDPVRQPEHIEILVRMLDNNGELIQPGGFIPVAERYDLMPRLDRWVVQNSLDWLQENQSEISVPRLMINLSGQSICEEAFLRFVEDLFEQYDIDSRNVCFEITETAAISNFDKAVNFIRTLKERGCEFALDDFGSGLSSFAYLKKLPVDYLKIDGAFVKEIEHDPIDRAMVRSINEIGHVMLKKTVAEFVENKAILGILKDIGVNFAQGYGIARPQPLDGFIFGEVSQAEEITHE